MSANSTEPAALSIAAVVKILEVYSWYVRSVFVLGFLSNLGWGIYILIKRQPSSLWPYLVVVAFGDSLFLLVLAATMIRYTFFSDPELKTSWLCQITLFVSQATRSVSSWTWLIMAVRRLFSLLRPMEFGERAVQKRCNFLIAGNVIFWCIMQSYPLFLAIDRGVRFGGCDITVINADDMSIVITLDIMLSYLLPFLLLISINIAFLKLNLKRLGRHRLLKKDSSTTPESGSQRLEQKSWAIMKLAAVVALLDMSLNVPNQVVRLLVAFNAINTNDNGYTFLFCYLSFAIFYSQFLLNNSYFYAMVCYTQRLRRSTNRRASQPQSSKQQLTRVTSGVSSSQHKSFLSIYYSMRRNSKAVPISNHVTVGQTNGKSRRPSLLDVEPPNSRRQSVAVNDVFI